jgi:membrane protein YdbS with pleckstrin-like domain
MKCPKCGAAVQAEAVYCHVCGARLDEAPAATPSAAAEGEADGKKNFNRRVEVSRGKTDSAEEELWQGGFSPRAMFGTWIACGVITLVAIVASFLLMAAFPLIWAISIPAVLLLWAWQGIRFALRRLGLSYRLTNQRFFHESGILRRTTNRIEVIDMDDITYTQGIVDRFFGVGTIRVSSSDITHPVLVIEGIDDVQVVAGQIDNARRAERLRRGLHIESV